MIFTRDVGITSNLSLLESCPVVPEKEIIRIIDNWSRALMIDILSMPSSLLCAWKSLSGVDYIREYYSQKSEVHGSALLFSMLGVSSKLAWGFLSTLYCWKTGRLSLWYLCIASRNLHFLLTWRPSAGLNLELMDTWTDGSKDFGCLDFGRLEHCSFFSSPFACLTALPHTDIPLTNTHTI